MTDNMNVDQQVLSAVGEEQPMVPLTSTEHFQNFIDQADFMLDDENEGICGYDDCEMMPADGEPTTFKFDYEDDFQSDKDTQHKKVSTLALEKKRSSTKKKSFSKQPITEVKSKN